MVGKNFDMGRKKLNLVDELSFYFKIYTESNLCWKI